MLSHNYISLYRYKFLDSKFVGKSLNVVLPKLAVDALLVTPVNLTLFYVGKFFSLKYKNEIEIGPVTKKSDFFSFHEISV